MGLNDASSEEPSTIGFDRVALERTSPYAATVPSTDIGGGEGGGGGQRGLGDSHGPHLVCLHGYDMDAEG